METLPTPQSLGGGGSSTACDESKCVSRGRSSFHNDSFTCYGDDGTLHPAMCADGYLPWPTENQTTAVDETSGMPLWYFTCCPPGDALSESTDSIRHCSDPITVSLDDAFDAQENSSTETLCQDQDTRRFPRRMKPISKDYESYLCCDSVVASTIEEEEFLENTECVPYRNEGFQPAQAQNRVGEISVVWCDFSEGSFQYPRPIDENLVDGVSSTGNYQCCRNGPPLPPYVRDSAFRITLYPTMVLCAIAAVASILVIAGLLIPLVTQLRDGSFQRAQLKMRRNRSSRVSLAAAQTNSDEFMRPTLALAPSQRSVRTSTARSRERQSFSTFNLYLVYLAIPDLLFALYRIGTYAGLICQNFNPNFYPSVVLPPTSMADKDYHEGAVGVSIAIVNLWLNAIVSYQLLVLLQTSKAGRRINSPTLKRISLQAGAIYLFTVVSFCIHYSINYARWKMNSNDNAERSDTLRYINLLYTSLITFLPFGYVVYVTLVVWCRGYISLDGITARGRAMRELFLYFFRIIVVFIGVWIPGIAGVVYAILSGKGWSAAVISQSVPAVQSIATTLAILTKSDVRNYIWDLITLSYLFGNKDTPGDIGGSDHFGFRESSKNSGTAGSSHFLTKDSTTRTSSRARACLSLSAAFSATDDANASGDIHAVKCSVEADDDYELDLDDAEANSVKDDCDSDSDAELEADAGAIAHSNSYPSKRARNRQARVLSTGELSGSEDSL